MTLTSHASSSAFINLPTAPAPPVLFFFVTGNPGLISYYDQFFALLIQVSSKKPFAIAGFSLGGFEVVEKDVADAGDSIDQLRFPRSTKKAPDELYSLSEQISLTYSRLEAVCRALRGQFNYGNKPVPVILAGHSVGAYMSLEIIRQRHEANSAEWKVIAAALLAPTIMDLAKSPSGRIATPLFSIVPGISMLAQMAVRGLKLGLGDSWLSWLVAKVTGMEGDGLATTLAFLKSRCGVKQALEMAKEELKDITTDQWGEEVWGAVEDDRGDVQTPELFLLFAKNDHWVADVTREEIKASRGRRADETVEKRIVIEESSVSHAWCLRENKIVIARLWAWMSHILREQD